VIDPFSVDILSTSAIIEMDFQTTSLEKKHPSLKIGFLQALKILNT
jgi:hypothetical protein